MKTLFPAVVLFLGLGCALPGEGEPCTDANKCDEGLTCVNNASDKPTCMRDCAVSDVTCDDGLACVALSDSTTSGVCWPGGSTALGETCTGGQQCTGGGICVNTGGGATCHQACKPPSTEFCQTGEICVDSTGGGFCRVE